MSDGIGSNIDGLRIAAIGAWELAKSKYFVPLMIVTVFILMVFVGSIIAGVRYYNMQKIEWQKTMDEAEAITKDLKVQIEGLKAEGTDLRDEIEESKKRMAKNNEKIMAVISYYSNTPVPDMVRDFEKRTGIPVFFQ